MLPAQETAQRASAAFISYRQATERSNKQILTPLNWFDIIVVAGLTGVSEELLFRGAIIPGSFIDWWVDVYTHV